jgi:branched-chain amino acid transport system ATP-binding protein
MRAHLEVRSLTAGYGDITVLRSVAFSAMAPGITAIIGSNGACKTTLLRVLSGLAPAKQGAFSLDGRDLGNLGPDGIVAEGIAHVPEGRRLFAAITVEDNLLRGAFARRVGKTEIRRDLASVY